MRYVDPFPVTCGRCSADSTQPVSGLLRLRAACPTCGASFAEVGQKMRAGLDDWGNYITLIEIARWVETTLGEAISDTELEGVRTLRDIALIVRRHLPSGPASEDQSIKLVREAAQKSLWCSVDEVAFDALIMNAIAPDRWSRE